MKERLSKFYHLHPTGLLPLTEQVSRVFSPEGDYLLYGSEGSFFTEHLPLQAKFLRTEVCKTKAGTDWFKDENGCYALFPVSFSTQCLSRDLIDPFVVLSLLTALHTEPTGTHEPLSAQTLPQRMERAFSDMVDFSEKAPRSGTGDNFFRYIEKALQTAAKARGLLTEDDFIAYQEDPKNHVLCLRDLRPENFFMDKDGQLKVLSVFAAAPGLVGDDMAKLLSIYAPDDALLSEKLLRASGLSEGSRAAVFAELLFPWDFWSAGYRVLAQDDRDLTETEALCRRNDTVEALMEAFQTEKSQKSIPSVPIAPKIPKETPLAASSPKTPDISCPLTWTFPQGR